MEHFPRYWTFVRGIHRSPVHSQRKGQWRGAFMFSLICIWINGWVNKREASDLRRYRAHYDVTVMQGGITRPHHINITDMPKHTQLYCMAYQLYCLQSHFQVLIFVRTTPSNSVLFCCGPWYPPRSKPANHSLTSLTKFVYLPWFLVNIHHARR